MIHAIIVAALQSVGLIHEAQNESVFLTTEVAAVHLLLCNGSWSDHARRQTKPKGSSAALPFVCSAQAKDRAGGRAIQSETAQREKNGGPASRLAPQQERGHQHRTMESLKAMVIAKLDEGFGRYVDGITAENLKLQIFGGTITQENMSLKPEALAALNLPVAVRHGFVGRFHVVVPWRNLSTQPCTVEIDDVLLLATANSELLHQDMPSLAEKIAAAAKSKLQRLSDAEIARKAKAVASGEETMLERLGRRVLDNLQVRLSSMRAETPPVLPHVAAYGPCPDLS